MASRTHAPGDEPALQAVDAARKLYELSGRPELGAQLQGQFALAAAQMMQASALERIADVLENLIAKIPEGEV